MTTTTTTSTTTTTAVKFPLNHPKQAEEFY